MALIRNRGKNARNVSQKIWLSSAEAEQIRNAAGDAPVATWLRDLALGQPATPRASVRPRKATRVSKSASEMHPVAVAVARVGNNLNQIARAVNRDLMSRKPLDAILVANQLVRLRSEMHAELKWTKVQLLRRKPDAGENL